MLVLSRKNDEAVVIGGSVGFEGHDQSHGGRDQERASETGFRGRLRCSSPSYGSVGKDPRRDTTWPNQLRNQCVSEALDKPALVEVQLVRAMCNN